MLKTNANCHFGCRSSYGYSILRPNCQLYTSGIVVLRFCCLNYQGNEEGTQRKQFLWVPMNPFLHLNLNMVTLQPFDHELILLAWREPGQNRFPRSPTTDAAVFRLGN